MRRCMILFYLILGVLLGLLLIPSYLLAAITGVCSNCHTMHNSFQGQPMASYSNGTAKATPNEMLLRLDCIGCHMSSVAGATNPSTYAPAVYHTTDPTGTGPGKTLAGGDFYWVAQGNDRKGHNVAGIANQDSAFGFTPPGWDPTATASNLRGQIANGAASWSQQLSCWGTYGCHGTNSGLKGHHQNVNGKIDNPTSVASSYRFLYGIKGYEAADWEWNATQSNHNEYYGYDFGPNNATYDHKDTISYLCAECHGQFYKDRHSGSAWLRHPTDYMLPNSGEYANYNNGSGYSLASPVARPTVYSAPSSTVTPGTDAIVMCLSCHRAHGSEYNSILRWEYSSTSQAGCKVCHTQK
mgnify:CR=1 FL=1